MKIVASGKNAQILQISRLLTPENKAHLLALVRVGYVAENAARKSPSRCPAPMDGQFKHLQEYSCENTLQRSKK